MNNNKFNETGGKKMKANKVIIELNKIEKFVTGNFEACRFRFGDDWYFIRVNVFSDATCQYYIHGIEGSETGYTKALYNFIISVFGLDDIELFGKNIYKFKQLFSGI